MALLEGMEKINQTCDEFYAKADLKPFSGLINLVVCLIGIQMGLFVLGGEVELLFHVYWPVVIILDWKSCVF